MSLSAGPTLKAILTKLCPPEEPIGSYSHIPKEEAEAQGGGTVVSLEP